MKNNFLKKLVRKAALFCTLTNLFNIWLKRRQPELLICFCSPSAATSHYYNLWLNSVHSQENRSEKGKQRLCIVMKTVLNLQSP